VAVGADGGTSADVLLACGNTRFAARITRASCARLELSPGKPVFAIVKSLTVDMPARA
jgi:molybdate transport system ATP-binding protein